MAVYVRQSNSWVPVSGSAGAKGQKGEKGQKGSKGEKGQKGFGDKGIHPKYKGKVEN